ncbi:cuticle protein 16.5-like [Anoplophora glabripennis]|uniref:cuticle protein 16.5-like n=1 Tax=Anoplophora glabripennis TaxID=217634 RepID=UPI000C761713|nr:cuticle protein 16.5-like [Anoplophora glabripennis]
MNSFAIVAFLATLAAAHAGLIAPAAQILQGPSSRTTLVGPEGSVISSVAPGGQVITGSLPGAVAYSAPVVAAAPVVSTYAAPAVVASPVVSAYSAPVVAGGLVGEQTVVAGPSGTIATGKTLAAPAVAAYAAPLCVPNTLYLTLETGTQNLITMNTFTVVAFLTTLAVAHAGVIAPVAEILQGPSSRTTLVGPEGSVISSVAPGGQVITESLPGAVAYSAPVVAAAPLVSTYAAPAVLGSPIVSAYSAPVVAAGLVGEQTVVAGPSGTIATGQTLAAPAVAAYAAPIW